MLYLYLFYIFIYNYNYNYCRLFLVDQRPKSIPMLVRTSKSVYVLAVLKFEGLSIALYWYTVGSVSC